jgi:phosphoglycolate phosphatase
MIRLSEHAIHAVLFDLDGTLVRTQIDFPRMYAEMRAIARETGTPDDSMKDLQALEIVVLAVAAAGKNGGSIKRRMFDALESIEREGCANPSPMPGAGPLFARLSELGIATGVVTRNCRSVSESLLSRFGLKPDVLLTRDDVPRTKPDPDHVLRALDQLDALPAQSAMVGDHWQDIEVGRSAGCAVTVGVMGDRDRSWFEAIGPTYVVPDLWGILDLIRE